MSRDGIQSGAVVVFGLAAIGLAVWMTTEGIDPRPIRRDADAGSSVGTSTVDAGVGTTASATMATRPAEDLDAGLFLSSLPSLTFGDASPPANGPKKIRVGIVLVTFAGAEGAPASARPKAAALTIAQRLAEDAKSDFKKAVQGGDPGSDADFGHLERGILSSQPQAEAAVFGLEPGAVSDVVETTRGYWIVKRID